MERNLTFYPNLYMGESINPKKLDKLKYKLIKKPLFAKVYVIAIASNPIDQLDIFEAKQLAWNYYVKHPVHIVGLAGNYDEAVSIVQQIVGDCMESRNDCLLKEYLLC